MGQHFVPQYPVGIDALTEENRLYVDVQRKISSAISSLVSQQFGEKMGNPLAKIYQNLVPHS